MTKRSPEPDQYADIRESVRALCVKFPGDYWRALDRERAYPEEFVAALTKAGFLAALIYLRKHIRQGNELPNDDVGKFIGSLAVAVDRFGKGGLFTAAGNVS